MPRVKKIAAPKIKRTRFNDQDPAHAMELNEAFGTFCVCVCVKILDWPVDKISEAADRPLNLNTVFDQLLILKTDRDAWRTRCESIEAAFNESNE